MIGSDDETVGMVVGMVVVVSTTAASSTGGTEPSVVVVVVLSFDDDDDTVVSWYPTEDVLRSIFFSLNLFGQHRKQKLENTYCGVLR